MTATTPSPARLRRRGLLLACCAAPLGGLLGGCGRHEAVAVAGPAEIQPDTVCSFDGMQLAEYGGPKAQIFYADAAAPLFFCDTVEMFSALLKPEQVRAVKAVFVQDMARADWDHPVGHWFDAKAGFYVVGSRRPGSMGPTFASFAAEPDAQAFAREHGGKVLPFAQVTPEMADLSGGGGHDHRM